MKKVLLIVLAVVVLLTLTASTNGLRITPVCYTPGRGYKIRMNGDGFDGVPMSAVKVGGEYSKSFVFTGVEEKIRLAESGDYGLYRDDLSFPGGGSPMIAVFHVPLNLPQCNE